MPVRTRTISYEIDPDAVNIFVEEKTSEFTYIPATKHITKGKNLIFRLDPKLGSDALFTVVFKENASPVKGQIVFSNKAPNGPVDADPGAYHYMTFVTAH